MARTPSQAGDPLSCLTDGAVDSFTLLYGQLWEKGWDAIACGETADECPPGNNLPKERNNEIKYNRASQLSVWTGMSELCQGR